MFRPNRIGTPWIHQNNFLTNDDSNWLNEIVATSPLYPGNVINAVPLGDFGRSFLQWNGTETLAAAFKASIVQQFVISPPIQGDTVGVEIAASIITDLPPSTIIIPFFNTLQAAGGTTLAPVAGSTGPTYLEQQAIPNNAVTTAIFRHCSYKTQVIVRDPNLAGIYCHGFAFLNGSASPASTSLIEMNAEVRQLNDQQDIGYRDTLR